jgi:basic membrane protein A and related proteins
VKKRMRLALVAGLAGLALFAAACGDDSGTTTTPTTAAPSATTAAGAATTTTAPQAQTCTVKATADQLKTLDSNGDGKLVIGVATPGPRNDGAYYQALVDCVDRLTKANGGTSIVVDKIATADAPTQIEALAKQNVDIMMIGASEIAQALPGLAAKYDKVFWYCNCGAAGPEPHTAYAQSNDQGTEINYSGGYATGLLLKAKGKSKVAFIGNNNLNFEVASFEAFKLGLKAVDSTFDVTYYATGSFNDVQKATEAYNTAKSAGVGAVYPYLGGAHEAVVKLANKDDIITMSAGRSDACTRTDIKYQIAIRFDAGDYLDTIFKELLAGNLKEGSVRTFHVGKDKEPGAVICGATADQTTAMTKVYTDIASGKFDADFLAINKKAFNF